MGDFSADRTEIAVHQKTLEPNVVDTVTFAWRRQAVEVANLSPEGSEAYIVFTTDGSDPAVAGRRTVLLVPGGTAEVEAARPANDTVVKLISAEAAVYSVTAASGA